MPTETTSCPGTFLWVVMRVSCTPCCQRTGGRWLGNWDPGLLTLTLSMLCVMIPSESYTHTSLTSRLHLQGTQTHTYNCKILCSSLPGTASIAQRSDSLLLHRKYVSALICQWKDFPSYPCPNSAPSFYVRRWGEIIAIQYSVNDIKILHTHFLRLHLQAESARFTYRQSDDSHVIWFHYPAKPGETYDLITIQRCLASLVYSSLGTM